MQPAHGAARLAACKLRPARVKNHLSDRQQVGILPQRSQLVAFFLLQTFFFLIFSSKVVQ